MSLAALTQLEEILSSIDMLARGRDGRVAAITIGAPKGSPADLSRRLALGLAARGHKDVEISVEPQQGALRLVAMEFDR